MSGIRFQPKYTVFAASRENKKSPLMHFRGGRFKLCCGIFKLVK
jgi:hypothetical protein